MRNRWLPVVSVQVCIMLLLTVSCARHQAETRGQGTYHLAIASDGTPFKEKLCERLVNRYGKTCHIDLVDIGDLKRVHAELYDAVLIMDSCYFWGGLNPSLKSFISNGRASGRTVLFMSAGDPGLRYSYGGVDAITSASSAENEDGVYSEIVGRVDAILFVKLLPD